MSTWQHLINRRKTFLTTTLAVCGSWVFGRLIYERLGYYQLLVHIILIYYTFRPPDGITGKKEIKISSKHLRCCPETKTKQLQVQEVLCSFRFIFQIKIFHIKLLQRMITSTYSKDLIVLEVLNLSQTRCHQDVTLNCSNGTVHSNSFLLASIFPVIRRALETTIQYQDPVLILIPDMDIIELQTFLLHLREHHSMMSIREVLTRKKKKKVWNFTLGGGGSGQNWVIFTLFLIFFLSCPKSCVFICKEIFFLVWGGGYPLTWKSISFWT